MSQSKTNRGASFPLLKASGIADIPETVNVHQFNDKAIRHSKSLGDATGLSNIGIHLVRLQKGCESTQFHRHQCDEEFLYILSGSGIAEIGDNEYPVEAGDFMGFSQDSPAHNMRNPNDEDLVYLMGGDRNDFDICDYPRIKRRMFRVNGVKTYVDLKDLHDVAPGNETTSIRKKPIEKNDP